jgi:ketosteroid isomerase-like protein
MPPVGVPDPVAEHGAGGPARGEPAPIRRYRAKRPRRLWASASAVAAIAAAAAIALAVVPGGADTPQPGQSVSSADVERMANSFASAYADEDATRIARLLTSDAQRVGPDDDQDGRRQVAAAYESQFQRNAITGFELAGLSAQSGSSGRATAHYTVTYKGAKPTTGQMTWIVINEKGRPRISLIAFRPDGG